MKQTSARMKNQKTQIENLWSQQENGRGGGTSVDPSVNRCRFSGDECEGWMWSSAFAIGGEDDDEVVVESIVFSSSRGGIDPLTALSPSSCRLEAGMVFSGSDNADIQFAGKA